MATDRFLYRTSTTDTLNRPCTTIDGKNSSYKLRSSTLILGFVLFIFSPHQSMPSPFIYSLFSLHYPPHLPPPTIRFPFTSCSTPLHLTLYIHCQIALLVGHLLFKFVFIIHFWFIHLTDCWMVSGKCHLFC